MKFDLKPVIDFGQMPIANAFLTPDQFASEYFYNMVVGYDPKTFAIGLINKVPPEKMFHDNYAFFSSTSKGMQKHFRETAEKLQPIAGKGIVVEMGSNDGIMLEAWKDLGVRAIGVEPSGNVAQVSRDRGHEVISKFMSLDVADEILEKGKVSLVFGANVSCHIEDFWNYAQCIAKLIGREGVFVFEDPYFMDIVEKTSYDQVYDEHVWYFTIKFINHVFGELGYQVFDVEHIDVHGGELRMYVGHKDTHAVKDSVAPWLAKEQNLESQLEFLKKNIEKSKKNLVELLQKLKGEGKNMCGFGATPKGVIITTYCGIGPELVPFITDNTPIKQGKFYPGSHVPIVPQEKFTKEIDYAFLFAWNHLKEIDRHFGWFREKGGHWITHVPAPHIL